MRDEFLSWVRSLPSVNENWKYGLVLMGFLVEYLLDRQMEKKGCKPFWKPFVLYFLSYHCDDDIGRRLRDENDDVSVRKPMMGKMM